jgi:hypothetical protein
MIQRREFFGLAAAVPAAALTNLNGVKSRQVSKWEISLQEPPRQAQRLEHDERGHVDSRSGPRQLGVVGECSRR